MPFAQIGNNRCFYQDIGEGYPLLFGHSFLWSTAMWKPQIEELSKEFRCIAVDLWDHGKSGHLIDNNFSLEKCADEYHQLMEHLGITEFAVIGLSVGGMWGTYLTLKYPQSVSALVLMDTFVGDEPKPTQERYFQLADLMEKEQKLSEFLVEQIVPLFFSPYSFQQKKGFIEDFRRDLLQMDPKNIPGVAQLSRIIFSRENLLNNLQDIFQPSLVIVGKDDIPRPPKESQEMAERLPNATLHIIENAGHISNLEQPESVNSILLNFLQNSCSINAFKAR